MEIKKINFTWRQPLIPLNLSRVDGIALHHMHHPTADIREVERWHLDNDNRTWKGFGYGWWIGKNGEIYEGRGYHQNAGVANHNHHVLSIGFQGGYEPTDKFKCDREMPVLQYNSGVWLLRKIIKEVPTIRVIHGHGYWVPTTCPGKYFPLAEMVTDVYRKEPEHWADGAYTFLTKEKGITVHEKRFDDTATRGDMFVMLARVLGYRG